MTRPLRIEYPGAFYHVTSRGNERKDIFKSNTDREMFLSYLESAHQKYEAVVHAYCLMSNYYHLMIETPSGNLPLIMKYINGSYTDWGTRGRRLNNHHSPPHCVRRELMLIDLRANSPPDGYSGNSPQREHRNAFQILQRRPS